MSLFHNLPKYVDTVEEQIRQLTGSNFINQAQKTMNFNVSELVSKASSQATKILESTFTGVGTFLGRLLKLSSRS